MLGKSTYLNFNESSYTAFYMYLSPLQNFQHVCYGTWLFERSISNKSVRIHNTACGTVPDSPDAVGTDELKWK
jgi:hypothetical protein